MEEELRLLAERLAELEASAGLTNTMFAEAYYYITIPLMILIHVGFLAYEMGATRMKNVLSSGDQKLTCLCYGTASVLFLWLVGLLGFPHGVQPKRRT